MGDELAGKVVLVSGAGRGIGEAVARRLHRDGAAVVCGDIDETQVKTLSTSLGERVLAVDLDVRSEESWQSAVTQSINEFGTLDGLVNNAGILKPMPLLMTSLEDFRSTIEVNEIGVFLGIRAVAPLLLDRGTGSIVNLSSMLGLVAEPFTAAYAGVRVNSVHPGYVGGTNMLSVENLGVTFTDVRDVTQIPLKRMGTPEDVADLVRFLISDESRYCTGAEFVIDGGLTAAVPGTTGI
jgi:3alpha(or 20beta)-hydroxysteroid dehydrogenase